MWSSSSPGFTVMEIFLTFDSIYLTCSLQPEICSAYSSFNVRKCRRHPMCGCRDPKSIKISWIGAHISPMWEVVRQLRWSMGWMMVPIIESCTPLLSVPCSSPSPYSHIWVSPELLVLFWKVWDLHVGVGWNMWSLFSVYSCTLTIFSQLPRFSEG